MKVGSACEGPELTAKYSNYAKGTGELEFRAGGVCV